MNPDNMKEYNELLWLGVKKNKRDSVRGQRSTRYVDPAHVCMVELTSPSEEVEDYICYSGEDEIAVKMPTWENAMEQTMHCPVEYLKRIVDNIRSEDVKITVGTDYPIKLEWRDGEDSWKVLIAPRIENE